MITCHHEAIVEAVPALVASAPAACAFGRVLVGSCVVGAAGGLLCCAGWLCAFVGCVVDTLKGFKS